MSIWTHVIGCIRLDGMPSLPEIGGSKEDIIRILGPISTYENQQDISRLPRGSEGSLEYQIIEYNSGLPWLVIPIWGDLRDYDNITEIQDWWKQTLASFKIVRDAVLRVEVEKGPTIILSSGAEHDVIMEIRS